MGLTWRLSCCRTDRVASPHHFRYRSSSTAHAPRPPGPDLGRRVEALDRHGVAYVVAEDYVVAERARGVATSTLTTKLMAARALFGWLVDTGQHPGPNPATGVRPPRSTTRPREPYRPQDAT